MKDISDPVDSEIFDEVSKRIEAAMNIILETLQVNKIDRVIAFNVFTNLSYSILMHWGVHQSEINQIIYAYNKAMFDLDGHFHKGRDFTDDQQS